MMHSFKTRLARLSAGAMLATTLATAAFGLQSTASFASNPACNGAGTTFDATAGSASCDMTTSITVNSGTLTLANDASTTAGAVTLNGTTQNSNFTFANYVNDDRVSTAGWELEASSANSGIQATVGGTTYTLPVALDSFTSTCTAGTCVAPALVTAGGTGNLNATSTDFIQAGDNTGTTLVTGHYVNTITGHVQVTPSDPAATYTGTITLTLVNAAD